jgi:hypothetical protein
MATDLSMIGIAGQEAGHRMLESQARVRTMNAQNEESAFKLEQLTKQQALADKAGALLNSISKNDLKTVDDPQEVLGKITRMSQPLEVVGDLYMRSGAPEQGMKFMQAASEIQKRESDIQKDALSAQQTRLENITKGAAAVSQYLGVAKNQSEWDYGIRQLRAQGIIEPELIDQMAKQPYDPDVAEYFNQQAMSAGDRARLEMQAGKDALQARDSAIRIAQGNQRMQIQKAQQKETARHNLAMEKNSGSKSVTSGAPSEADRKYAMNALKTTVFRDVDVEDSADFNTAADYVASQAKDLVRNNKNMTWETAVQKTIIQGQQSGAFGVDPAKTTLWGMVEREPAKVKFQSPEAPVPMPKDKKQMKKGQVYDTSRGKARWNGTAFIPVD